jgi:DNA-binding XRE family transcriptional regulator
MNHRPFSELRAEMAPRRRARNEAAAKKTLAQLMIAEMRQRAGMTQRELAAALGVKQPTLAQMEKQGDMQISTLRRLIEALGGSLEITAHLPNGDVSVGQFDRA